MTSPHRRLFHVVVAALVVVSATTGCSVVQNVTGHAAGQTVTPRVGDCWRVTYAGAAQSEDWEGTGSVSCAATHESYTYAVTKLRSGFTGSWLDSTGKPRKDVDAAAFAACRDEQHSLLPAITATEALFYPTYYVPSIAQWNNGARWVRCDMTEIRVGSEIAKPSLTSLPASFADLVARVDATPRKFALCENDVFNNGPDGAGTTYADCTHPADWSFVVRLTLPGAATSPYPGDAQLATLGAQKCAAAVPSSATAGGHDVVAETPDETAWVKNGVRTVDCWLNNN